MKRIAGIVCIPVFLLALGLAIAPAQPSAVYVKKATRVDTILATLKASGLPTLEGTWHFIGPFAWPNEEAFDTAHPPEQEIDLKKTSASH